MLASCSIQNKYYQPPHETKQQTLIQRIFDEQPEPFVATEGTIPPVGWIIYCQENPLDISCKK
jgi:hypothetical protein